MGCSLKALVRAAVVSVAAVGMFVWAGEPGGIPKESRIPNEMQMGVTFGFYAPQGYFGSPQARDEVEAMARAGMFLGNASGRGRFTGPTSK